MGQRRPGLTRAGMRRAGSAGGAASGVTSWQGTQGLTPTVATSGAVVSGQTLVARWTLGVCRVYAVDGTTGDDANLGYADPATTSTADYVTACQLAGSRAKKTFAGLEAIFPHVLEGRTFEIVVAAGTYAEQPTFLYGLAGNAPNCDVRGTRTDTTAGVVKFDGSAADCTVAGMVTATGMNAAGYNPTGVPTTTSVPCLKVGGAAPAFAAEPARPLGTRMRFDAATATAALRGICRGVVQVNGTDTLVPATALPAAPAAADVFYLEEGGVVFTAPTLSGAAQGSVVLQLVGMRSAAGTVLIRNGGWLFTGCNFAVLTEVETDVFTHSTTYTHPVRGALTVAGGLRVDGAVTHQQSRDVRPGGAVYASTVLFDRAAFTAASTAPWVYNGPVTVSSAAQFVLGPNVTFGSTLALVTVCRVLTSVILAGGILGTGAVSIAGAGAVAGLTIQGSAVLNVVGVMSGATGNNDVGVDLTQAQGAMINLRNQTPTLTGALGNVRISGPFIVTWAQVVATGIIDQRGNRIVQSNLAPMSVIGKFSGGIVSSAVGATVAYLADPGGALAVANLALPQRYPTSLRVVSRLRVTVTAVLGGPLANAVSATVYKTTGGGAATATTMLVSIPAGTAVGTTFVDSAHPMLLLDGDTFDVRLDDAIDASGGTMTVSATLEGP